MRPSQALPNALFLFLIPVLAVVSCSSPREKLTEEARGIYSDIISRVDRMITDLESAKSAADAAQVFSDYTEAMKSLQERIRKISEKYQDIPPQDIASALGSMQTEFQTNFAERQDRFLKALGDAQVKYGASPEFRKVRETLSVIAPPLQQGD